MQRTACLDLATNNIEKGSRCFLTLDMARRSRQRFAVRVRIARKQLFHPPHNLSLATLQAPDLIRRLIVDGTGPRDGQGMELLTQAAGRLFGATYDSPDNVWLAVKFSPSAGRTSSKKQLPRNSPRNEARKQSSRRLARLRPESIHL
jgi:hypothetical protein